MKKVLMISHMGQMLAQFNKENIAILKKIGFEVHLAANFTSNENTMSVDAIKKFTNEMKRQGVYVHQVEFSRGLGTIRTNYLAWKELKQICLNNDFSLIHSQSPLGGVFGRLLAKKYRVKAMYTAHGFHFFKGGPIRNWIVFYPIEKWLAKYTDVLITINSEDYKVAKKMNKKMKVIKIPGVGVNFDEIRNIVKSTNNHEKRVGLGIPQNAFVIASVGELNNNKNHIVMLKALQRIKDPSIYYLICGKGKEYSNLLNFVNINSMNKNIKFLGYREDVIEVLSCSNLFAFPSKREGLGLAGIEAMAVGLPLITSNVSGIAEYSVNGETGFNTGYNNYKKFAEYIITIKKDNELQINIAKKNIEKAKRFSVDSTSKIMESVYKNIEGKSDE